MSNKFVSLEEFSFLLNLNGNETFRSNVFKKNAVRVVRQIDDRGSSLEQAPIDLNFGDEFKMQRIVGHNYYDALACGYIPLERASEPYLWHFCHPHITELEIIK